MTPDKIADIAALAEAATPGPWYSDDDWVRSEATRDYGEAVAQPLGSTPEEAAANVAFIAAARTAVPELLAEREGLIAREAEWVFACFYHWHELHGGEYDTLELNEADKAAGWIETELFSRAAFKEPTNGR